jgi:hypothetical protein
MRRRYLFLLLCVGAFLAWYIISTLQSPFYRALAEGKYQWFIHGPKNYRMRVSMYRSLDFGDFRLTVRDGIVTDATCEHFMPEECRAAADSSTIPKMFDYAEKMYGYAQRPEWQPVKVDFQFDPQYGFPLSLHYSSEDQHISDFGGGMQVTEFEVLP